MDSLKKIITVFILSFITFICNAQTNDGASNDLMRSNGKIYVVVAVVTIIMIGIFIYLLNLDRKISRLEKK
jgi:CcmD family protein